MGPPPRPPPDVPPLETLLASTEPGQLPSGELLRRLRPTGVMGALAQMPLTEILQNMDFGKRSGRVDAWLDGADGTVHVHDGQIVYAHTMTPEGPTVGESAILELCRRAGGFFHISYAREDVDRNIHRPTTFVLLEALRVIDESGDRGDGAERGETPAAVELGGDPWLDAANDMFPIDRPDDGSGAFNEPSTSLDIEVAGDVDEAVPQRADAPRFRAGFVVNVVLGGAVTALYLEDIGRTGAFVRADATPTIGNVVTLHLRVNDVVMPVPGRVIHLLTRTAAATVAREPGFGVRFDELSPDVASRLGTFVDSLAAQAAGSANPKDRLIGLVAESEFLVAAGDLESARRVLSQAQGLAPEDDHVRKKLLDVNESIDAAQANAFLERAMRGGPQAVELARRATQLRPVRDVLLRSLAVFARGGAHDEVADVAEQLLELDPDDEGALRTLLDANVAMQRWEVAVQAAESLLRLRPDDAQLRAAFQRVAALARKPR